MASLINFAILNVVIDQYITNINKEKGGLFWKKQVSKCFGCRFHRAVPLAASAASAEYAAHN